MAAETRGKLKPSGFTRREVVLTMAAAAASTTLLSRSDSSHAQHAGSNAVNGRSAAAVARFLDFSKAITGHDNIDPLTAGRIRDAMAHGDSTFSERADALVALMQPGMAPEALLAAASGAGLREAALAVVSAWYTGTVVAGKNTTVVAYEQALMYRPVADGLSVPTYCDEGPLWWTAAPPEVGVPTPQEAARQAASPPPVMRTQ